MHLKRLFVNKAHSASCDVYSYIVQNCMPWHENILILIQRQGSRPCTHTSLWQLRCVSWGIDNRRACLKIETDNVLLGIWKVFKKRHNDENNDVSMNIVPNCSSLLDFKMPAPKSLIWGPLKPTFMFPQRANHAPKQPLNQGSLQSYLEYSLVQLFLPCRPDLTFLCLLKSPCL